MAQMALATAVSLMTVTTGYVIQHEFAAVDYEWESEQARQASLDSGTFIVENNAITGLKACNSDVSPKCGSETRLWATVPRWLTGVPATLSEVVTSSNGQSLLRPWPSLIAQDPQDCDKIQYVQSMEITPDGLMWIVDVGRKYFNNATASDDSCPPKMVLIDIASEEIVDSYVFPSEVAPYTESFLNDIAVDVVDQIGYISSTGKGALVMYDRLAKTSRRFEHSSTSADGPVDGIALTPDRTRVFYCGITSLALYSISTEAFRDFSKPVEESLVAHGDKPDGSDGMAFGSDGSLFFGGLQTDAIYRWNPASSTPVSAAAKIAQDKEELNWVDTLAFDNRGNLLVTSNKLGQFFGGAMDFTKPNFRIISLDVGADSYMKGLSAGDVIA